MFADLFAPASAGRAGLEQLIERQIRDRIGTDVEQVTFDWSDVSGDDAVLKITVFLNAESNPRSWRGAFAGLTSKVRAQMGDQLSQVFPVISAQAAH